MGPAESYTGLLGHARSTLPSAWPTSAAPYGHDQVLTAIHCSFPAAQAHGPAQGKGSFSGFDKKYCKFLLQCVIRAQKEGFFFSFFFIIYSTLGQSPCSTKKSCREGKGVGRESQASLKR